MGLIVAYTGRGKGKTSACVGQAIRAAGSGLSVAFGQFMKRPGMAGEQAFLATLLGENYFSAGAGFFHSREQWPEQRRKALEVLAWACSRKADMLILDEALMALSRGILSEEELASFIPDYTGQNRHLVLSGPELPLWLSPYCDTVTEMRKIAHAHDRGAPPVCGIEY